MLGMTVFKLSWQIPGLEKIHMFKLRKRREDKYTVTLTKKQNKPKLYQDCHYFKTLIFPDLEDFSLTKICQQYSKK